jgi:PBP1b-binding outer membrane lipoprotein LpoB
MTLQAKFKLVSVLMLIIGLMFFVGCSDKDEPPPPKEKGSQIIFLDVEYSDPIIQEEEFPIPDD